MSFFMLQSMTAFARVQKELDARLLCWEIRAVNHRYLDVSFRLPEPFRFIETHLRNVLRDKVSRGKLECQLKFQDAEQNQQSLAVNTSLVQALVKLGEQLAVTHQVANDLSISRIMSWPGVVQTHAPNTEELAQQAISLFAAGIDELCHMRLIEGQALKEHIEGRLHDLQTEVQRAKLAVSEQMAQIKDKLLTRLQAIQMEVPETRVEQEIALVIARLDVSEELDRLQTHIHEVRRIINSDRVAGRRLDFLMQELNREANTLSSKSDSVGLTQSAVEMKVLIEQMREQIQNIE